MFVVAFGLITISGSWIKLICDQFLSHYVKSTNTETPLITLFEANSNSISIQNQVKNFNQRSSTDQEQIKSIVNVLNTLINVQSNPINYIKELSSTEDFLDEKSTTHASLK